KGNYFRGIDLGFSCFLSDKAFFGSCCCTSARGGDLNPQGIDAVSLCLTGAVSRSALRRWAVVSSRLQGADRLPGEKRQTGSSRARCPNGTLSTGTQTDLPTR